MPSRDYSRSPPPRRRHSRSPERRRRDSRSPPRRARRSPSYEDRRRSPPRRHEERYSDARLPPPPDRGYGGRDDRGGGGYSGGGGSYGGGGGGYGGGRGRDGYSGPPSSFTARGNRADGPGGGGAYEDDDFGIAATDFADFRRQKRQKLKELNLGCLWNNTPTPSPSPEREPHANGAAQPDSDASEERSQSRNRRRAASGSDSDGEAEQKRRKKKRRKASPDSTSEPRKPAAAAEAAPMPTDSEAVGGMLAEVSGAAAEIDRAEVSLFNEWLRAKQDAADAELKEAQQAALEEQDFVGPEPLPAEDRAGGMHGYGGALRPGEGEAMAAYVQEGKRIPRRGEVGLKADEIERFERIGYVMSGSRHNRMNAVRIRKENQIYTAEEKAALAMVNFAAQKEKEAKVLADLKGLVEKSLEAPDSAAAAELSARLRP